MSKCNFQQNTIKVPEGNAWQMLLPLKTARWQSNELVTEPIDYQDLSDIVVSIDGEPYSDWTMDEHGILVNIPAGTFGKGPHNTVVTAQYKGVDIRAAYFENFTIVAWSFETNVDEHLQESPLVSDPAYIYIGVISDEALEELKRIYTERNAELQIAIAAAQAAKDAFDRKAEAMDDVATKTDLEGLATKQDIAGLAEKTDLAGLATAQNVTDAKNEILAALPQEASAEFIQSLFANES